MSAKTTASKGKPARASQPAGKRTASGKRHQQGRAGLVRSPTGKNHASMRDSVPPALKISMQNRSGVHVDLMTLPKEFCLLDTESKLLKAMEDLFPIVSHCKEFRDNTRWSDSSSVSEVFHAFYYKLLKTLRTEWAKITLKDQAYKLIIKERVPFDVACPVMPVYWITTFEKANKDLFDLCFYLVVFLHQKSDIGLWGEDNDSFVFEHIESELADYRTHASDGNYQKEIAAYEQAYNEYGPNGTATSFHTRLWKSGASKRVWLQAFEEFQPKTDIQRDIYRWLKLGHELVIAGKSILEFISLDPEMEQDYEQYDELPSMPNDTVKFLWRDDDMWAAQFDSMAESISSNSGSEPFYIEKLIEHISDMEEIKDSFPAKLIRFMAAGRNLEKKYRNVFADHDKLVKALTPKPKPLIDIL